MRSTVESWNDEKGYGFIRDPQGGRDIFVHYRSILGRKGRPCLQVGDEVTFEVEQAEKGLRAKNVLKVS